MEENNVENEEVKEIEEGNNGIKIANDVISVIAGVAVSEVPGVASMAGGFAGGITEVLSGKKNLSKGIKVDADEKEVRIDVNIIVEYGSRIPDVAYEIQTRVKKSVENMTGLKVSEVNVHVQGVKTEKEVEEKEENEEDTKDFSERILGVELSRLKESEKIEENPVETPGENIENKPVEEEKDNNNSNVDVSNILENVETQIVTKNPISESFNNEINGVKIKNETSFDIPDDIMNTELDIDKNNILIFHTHTCESYTPSETYPYEQTGNFRTTDLNYTVARLGDELTNYLLGFGFKVNHDKTYHDYPAYTGSYSRSLESVKKDLQENPSDIIIDLHRDAIGSKSDYDPSVKIGDDVASQLMFVIGTNGGGLYHPNWQNNLRFAIKVQEIANEMYPGLFKPMIVRNSRYNQHLGKAAVIIEVGSTGNTLEQSLTSMKYLAKVFEKIKN